MIQRGWSDLNSDANRVESVRFSLVNNSLFYRSYFNVNVHRLFFITNAAEQLTFRRLAGILFIQILFLFLICFLALYLDDFFLCLMLPTDPFVIHYDSSFRV